MQDYTYQKVAVVHCPECQARIFIQRPIAPGQQIVKTCPGCGLRVIFERKTETDTARRPGPSEVK